MVFEVRFDELKIDPKVLSEQEFKEFAGREMQNQLSRLEKQLDGGRQADGKSLGRYSESYKKQIKKGAVKGTRGDFNKEETPVNLTVSGGLRTSRRVGLNSKGAELEFSGRFAGGSYAQLAKWLYAQGKQGWMAFSKRDVDTITKRFGKEVDKITKKLIEVKRQTGI